MAAAIVPAEDHQEMDESVPPEVIPPSSPKSMNDLPPELLTKVLEFVTLDANRNTMLGYRRINSQWKAIMDSFIEQRVVAGRFPVFPAMNLIRIEVEDQEEERVPLKVLLRRNPFPFNSLHLLGTVYHSRYSNNDDDPFLLKMSLSSFSINLTENLTSFSLIWKELPIKTFTVMLGSMRNLKRLRFENVVAILSITERNAALPSPPLLPCLTTMEVWSRWSALSGDGIDIVYVWLIASYANQLEHLDIQTYDPFPPLQPRHEYTQAFPAGETCSIATTSESAFKNLKKLTILNSTREFLRLSETPELRWISVETQLGWDLTRANRFHFGDLITFIENCGRALETLILDISWDQLTSGELFSNYFDVVQPQIRGGAKAPKLKALTIHYPDWDFRELLLSDFLLKFPALEVLQLDWFRPHPFDSTILDGEKAVGFESMKYQHAVEIDALKSRLALLFQQMCTIQQNMIEVSGARLGWMPQVDFWRMNEAAGQVERLNAQFEQLERSFEFARDERIWILKRLPAIGENIREVVAQQLLDRGGFWNICPSLKSV